MKHRKAKKGHDWAKLKKIETGCIWVDWNMSAQLFFLEVHLNLYESVIYNAQKSSLFTVSVNLKFSHSS